MIRYFDFLYTPFSFLGYYAYASVAPLLYQQIDFLENIEFELPEIA